MSECVKTELACEVVCAICNEFAPPGGCPEDCAWMRRLKENVADVSPVMHGRWEQDADGDWYCTNCDATVTICDSGKERTYRKPYCPNCGAKMDGDSHASD